MNLKEYLEKNEESMAMFSERSGITFHKLYHIIKGRRPTLETAVVLNLITDGDIEPFDILPKEAQKRVIKLVGDRR